MAEHSELINQYSAFFARNLEDDVDSHRYFGPDLGEPAPVVAAVIEAFEEAVNGEIAKYIHDHDPILEAVLGISRAWRLLSQYWASIWHASGDRDMPSEEDEEALNAAFDAAEALGLSAGRILTDALARFGNERF